jgi:hypothetical protein
MATVNWNSGVSGNWATGSDWSTGSAPGAGDIVSIGVGGSYSVTVAAAAAAYSLSISNQSASLDLAANLTLSGGLSDSQSLIDIAAGTLAVTGGAVTFGVNTNANGASVDGPGTLSTAAGVTATIDTGNNPNNYGVYTSLILGGGVTWSNSGTVADTGHIQIGDGSGETAKIVNNAGGVFQFETPYAQIYDNTNATGSFSNAGTIEVSTSTYFAPILTNTSTGVIDLQSGTLDLQANSTIAGTVTGGGVLQFNGGNSTITAATSGNLLVTGGALTLAETANITGNVSETSGGIYLSASGPTTETLVNGFADSQGELSLASGRTLAVTGGTTTFGVNNNANGASVDGPGTLSTAAGVTTTIDSGNNPNVYGVYTPLILGGGVTWSNNGTVADTGHIQIGDGNGETAKIVNNAGGVFEFEAPYAQIYDNTNATGSFSNAGTIEVGTSTYFAPLLTNTSTGVIDLQSGTLDLQADSTIGGTVTGGGVLQFNAGNSTITAGTDGNLLVTGADLTLAETASITGNVSETSGGIYLAARGPASETLVNGFADSEGQVSLGAGRTLAVTGGTVTFGVNNNATGASVDGPGTLSTAAGVTTTIDTGNNPSVYGVYTSLILGGGVTWSNSGTVADTGQIRIGDGSGETAKIVNNAGGVFEFEAPYAQIYNNTNATGSFSNAGTIDVGTNTNFSPLLTNTATGVIDLQAGTLDLQADAKIGGTVTGGGTLEFSGSGNSTITAVTSGNLLVAGGVLTLAEAKTISGSITETGGTVIVGKNLTLTGVLQDQGGLLQISGDTLTGKVVTTSGSGTISGYGSITGAVNNNGTVVAGQGQLTLGTGASGSGVFNLAGAGSLEFSGSATAVKIGFLSGGGETLLLAKPGAVSGTISGFGTNDSIDLLNTAATGLTYANGTLTVTGSTGTLATLDFSGSYVQANFSLQSDDIVFQPTAQSIAHMLPSGAQPKHRFVADPQHAYGSIGAPDMHDPAALFGHHFTLG